MSQWHNIVIVTCTAWWPATWSLWQCDCSRQRFKEGKRSAVFPFRITSQSVLTCSSTRS